MSRPTMTKAEASLALHYLKRVSVRGWEDEMALLGLIAKIERIATFSSRPTTDGTGDSTNLAPNGS